MMLNVPFSTTAALQASSFVDKVFALQALVWTCTPTSGPLAFFRANLAIVSC